MIWFFQFRKQEFANQLLIAEFHHLYLSLTVKRLNSSFATLLATPDATKINLSAKFLNQRSVRCVFHLYSWISIEFLLFSCRHVLGIYYLLPSLKAADLFWIYQDTKPRSSHRPHAVYRSVPIYLAGSESNQQSQFFPFVNLY